jgi:Fe-S cluster assembly ATPase SufC
MLIRRMAEAGTAVLFITHRDEMVTVADTASIMCLGNVIFTGSSAEAQQYYKGRCQPHLAQLGIQPWDRSLPEVQSALASNGGRTDDADSAD